MEIALVHVHNVYMFCTMESESFKLDRDAFLQNRYHK
jgi:hypothetical protein